ncbi:MAG TPA: hypothetical protein VGG79_00455 [Roseiarcus sp.]|jgi:hypothetical protein
MPRGEIKVVGDVTHVFAHRFVVKTTKGDILADLTPKGAERVTLKENDQVELIGEQKPSELKVRSIALNSGPSFLIDQPDHHEHHDFHEHQDHAGSEPALKTAEANGFAILGEPRRKPKHFEVLGRNASGDMVELHIELDGRWRKSRPVPEDDPKWAEEIAAAR